MMKTFMMILLLIAVGSYAYLHLPKFGIVPDKISMEKIKHSPNYKNGSFQNKNQIPLMVPKRSTLKAWSDFLFRKYPKTKPENPLPAVKTDIKNIRKNDDILIWFGHSSYYVQLDGIRFLIDPIFNGHASPLPFMIKAFDGTNIYSADDDNTEVLYFTNAKATICSFTRQIFLFIPLALILTHAYGLYGALYAGVLADIICFIVICNALPWAFSLSV